MKRYYYFKGVFLVLITMLTLSTACVYGAEESITVTTYYPSPYGVYSEMRLYPKSSPTPPCQEGTMYYDSDAGEKGLRVCDASGSPQSIGGQYDNLNWVVMTATDNSNSLAGLHVVGAVPNGWTTAGIQSWVQSIANTWGLRMVWNHFKMNPTVTPPTTDAVLGSGVATGATYPGGTRNTNYIPKFYNPNYEANSQIYDNGTNIGIGTASPGSKLSVNGGISAGTYAGSAAPPGGMIISGNVGIGTTSPNAKLHVSGDMRIPYNGRFKFGNTDGFIDGGGGEWIGNTSPDGSTNFGLRFYSGGLERMRIVSNGNVGIGTTNPGARLHVAGTMGCQFPGVGPWGGDFFLVAQEGNRPVARIWDDNGAENPVLQFAKGNSWFNLEFNGDTITMGGGGPVSRILVSNIAIGGAFPGYSATWSYETIGMHPTNNLRINFGSTERFVFGNDGSAYKPGGGGWGALSDERLKKNVAPLTGALDKIIRLNGVRFEWKNPEEHASHLGEVRAGFIAQDVEKVFPQFIGEIGAVGKDKELTRDGKAKSLSLPFDFDAYLVEAIKEQQAKIESLEARIEALEKR